MWHTVEWLVQTMDSHVVNNRPLSLSKATCIPHKERVNIKSNCSEIKLHTELFSLQGKK